jgi:hypothetical protein
MAHQSRQFYQDQGTRISIVASGSSPKRGRIDWCGPSSATPSITLADAGQAIDYLSPDNMTQTPGQSPTYGVPNGVGGYTTPKPGQALPYNGRQ